MLTKVKTPADVLVTYFDKGSLAKYLEIAASLRTAGIKVELYPDTKKLGQQLKYADARGFDYAIIAGEDELSRDSLQIKNLKTGQSTEHLIVDAATELAASIKKADSSQV